MAETYYITKYALTTGMLDKRNCNGKPSEHGYIRPTDTWASFKVGKTAFTSLEEALQAAEMARTKKIAGLRKQIANLEKLEFTVKDWT